ncbi:MAG TPA: hypothetical protein H9740_01430 [Candidatus Hungatella pullicola]|nr:hypothetical protein [Candidatus Hungatella pullicola]
MTSKNLFFRLTVEEMRRRLWAEALTFLLLFFTFPVGIAMEISSMKTRGGLTAGEIGSNVARWCSVRNPMLVVIVAVLSVIFAAAGFSYLHSRQKTDFYHSLPITREILFFSRAAVGIFIPFVIWLINLLLALAVLAVNGIPVGAATAAGFNGLAFFFVHYLLLYSVGVLAMIVTGNQIIGILLTVVFHVYFPSLIWILYGYFQEMFQTAYRGSGAFVTELVRHSSPLFLMGVSSGRFGDMNGTEAFVYLGTVILSALAVCAVTLIFYRRRGSEAAGKAIAFSWLKPCLKLPVVILVSLTGGLLFWSILRNIRWALFGLICGLVISHCVIEIIYAFDFKKLFSHKIQMAGGCIGAILIFAFFWLDIPGYDSYFPSREKVSWASVSFSSVDYSPGYGKARRLEDGNFYLETMSKDDYSFEHMRLADLETVEKLTSEAVQSMESGLNYERGAVYFSVQYVLEGGKTVKRSYQSDIEPVKELIEKLYNSREYKEGVYPILKEDGSQTAAIILSMESMTGTSSWKIGFEDAEARQEIVNTFKKELLELTAEEQKNHMPVGQIQFLDPVQKEALEEQERAQVPWLYGDVLSYGTYALYPSFDETIALLNEAGAQIQLHPSENLADQVQVRAENPDTYETVLVPVTDQETVQTLLDNGVLYSDYYLNWFWEGEDNVIFYVINQAGRGQYYSVPAELVKGQIPSA